jgi:secondary thiamine-phosphate synthase enzyme
MPSETFTLEVSTKGNTDIIDITDPVRKKIRASRAESGTVTVFCQGSTGGVTTIEYEPGLKHDIRVFLETLLPYDRDYEHHKTWNDDNGSAHLRSALIGPSLTVPFVGKELTLGTWQQIVFLDFDTRPRKRTLILQVVY